MILSPVTRDSIARVAFPTPLPQEYPEGATSLAGPLATLTKLQWLELRYSPLAACGREGGAWWTGGRAEGECGWAGEGRNTLCLAMSFPQPCRAQTASFPTSPPPPPMTAGAPPRRRRNALCPGSALALAASLARLGGMSYLNCLGPGGVARAAGRPVVPEPQCRMASQGEQVLF